MPIRHCEKCGLKVLIEEGQSTVTPFYCQRCAALVESGTRKVEEGAEAPAEPPKTAPPLRVVCPYCKATFSGRTPSKPAKGNCPVCRKELVLLPNGEIQPASIFDPSRTVKDEEAESSTKKDEGTPPPPSVAKPRVEKEAPPRPVTAPPPPKPASLPKAEPKPAPLQKAPVPPRPAIVKPKPAAANRPVTVPPPSRPPPTVPPAPAGIGRIVVASFLLLLPVVGGGAFWNLREGSLKAMMEKLGTFGSRGLKKIYSKFRQEPAAVPSSNLPDRFGFSQYACANQCKKDVVVANPPTQLIFKAKTGPELLGSASGSRGPWSRSLRSTRR